MNHENHMVRPYADDEAPAERVERDDPDDYDRSEWIEDRDELKEALTDIASTEADERIRAEATRVEGK